MLAILNIIIQSASRSPPGQMSKSRPVDVFMLVYVFDQHYKIKFIGWQAFLYKYSNTRKIRRCKFPEIRQYEKIQENTTTTYISVTNSKKLKISYVRYTTSANTTNLSDHCSYNATLFRTAFWTRRWPIGNSHKTIADWFSLATPVRCHHAQGYDVPQEYPTM